MLFIEINIQFMLNEYIQNGLTISFGMKSLASIKIQAYMSYMKYWDNTIL